MNKVLLHALALLAFVSSAFAQNVTRTNQRWEHTLQAAKSYKNPLEEVQVNVRFTGPNGDSFEVPVFWDGKQTFRFRIAFPKPGTWTWQTTSSDPADTGLHNQQGSVMVRAYRGDHPLYRHGFLRVKPGLRYLTHEDGTPFLWMGDTGWYVLWGSTMDEWRHYVDSRAKNGFTVLQVKVMNTKAIEDTLKDTHRKSFLDGRPNPVYWRLVDEKVEYANRKGIVVMLVGIGRPSGKDPAAPMATRGFARFVAGRVSGNHVILSPSMDTEYAAVNDSMGFWLDAATSRHLITHHVNTSLDAAVAYHPKPYVDFDGMQSGHVNGNVNRAFRNAREWTATLRAMTPVKPVINTEAMYDGRGGDAGPNWREKDVRRLGYISWLSGALGYTYGAGETDRHVKGTNGGLWGFNSRPNTFDYWKNTLDWPSASQMRTMHEFFAGLPWWQLEPAPGLISATAEADSARAVLARTPDGNLAVAYLPASGTVEIDLRALPAVRRAVWIDPVRNRRIAAREKFDPAKRQSFTAPGPGDWLLLLSRD